MKVEPLSEAENRWLASHLALARKWILAGDGDTITSVQLDDLSERLSAELGDGDPNPIINVLGVAFGEILRVTTGLDWRIVTDEYGTDLALFGEPSVVIVPANLVAKRWTAKQFRFMAALEPMLSADVLRARGGTPKR